MANQAVKSGMVCVHETGAGHLIGFLLKGMFVFYLAGVLAHRLLQ